jgi:ABC-type branched-subunit amino acid transport system substrate-binding protein
MQAGMNAAFAKVNSQQGVHGRQLTLISKDDGYNPERCVENTFALIDEDMVFCLAGYVGTPTAKEAVPVIEEFGIPLVGLFTGAGFLRQPVKPDIFNVRASYDEETEAIVERLTTDLGIKKIAVFHQDDSFGAVGLNGTTKALKKRNMTISGTGTYTRNTTDVAAGLKAVMAAQPEAVVMVGAYKPLAAFIHEAKSSGFNPVFATISFTGTEAIIEDLGGEAEGLVISQVVPDPHDGSVPAVASFHEALQASNGGEPSFGKLEGYLTARVLIAGVEAAGKDLTRDNFRSALQSLNADLGGIQVGFSAENHQALSQVWMTQVSGGKAKVVSSISR